MEVHSKAECLDLFMSVWDMTMSTTYRIIREEGALNE